MDGLGLDGWLGDVTGNWRRSSLGGFLHSAKDLCACKGCKLDESVHHHSLFMWFHHVTSGFTMLHHSKIDCLT